MQGPAGTVTTSAVEQQVQHQLHFVSVCQMWIRQCVGADVISECPKPVREEHGEARRQRTEPHGSVALAGAL